MQQEYDELFRFMLEHLSRFYVEMRFACEGRPLTPLTRATIAVKRLFRKTFLTTKHTNHTKKMTRLSVNRLAKECAKLDPRAEQALSEEGMSKEVDSWPKY